MTGGGFMIFIKAFIVGGLLCAIAQILIDKTMLTPARILTAYVVLGVLLSAIGLYEPLVEFAGAGATVPLTGFGHNLAKGVEKAVAENGLFGVITGGLSANSAGITAALLLAFICALIFKSRADK
jgi:stage V sporulation protein AE